MNWHTAYFAFFTLLTMGCGYLWVKQGLGPEAAHRNLRYTLPWLLTGFAIAAVLPLFAFPLSRSWNLLYLLPVIIFSIWGLRWPHRKQRAGDLLLNAGRTWYNKTLFWIGILEGGVATFITWLSFGRLFQSATVIDKSLQLPRVAFWWTIAIVLVSLGLSNLEIREKGLCFLYGVIPWRQIRAYRWEASQPNTLTVYYVERRFFLRSSFISIRVPAKFRDSIDQIVAANLREAD
ncbi:MAG: hypothetical protein AAFP20_16510 [Cyanobacteria bacterium J06614_10]